MGADIAVEGGYVIAAARGGLKGARIDLPLFRWALPMF